MPSKIVSALAAGALLVGSSSALAQTSRAPTMSPALMQSATGEANSAVEDEDRRPTTVIIVVAVIIAITLLIWLTGDDDEPQDPPPPPPVSP